MKNSILTLTLSLLSFFASAQVSITFEVNVSYQIEQGLFDPANESVDIAGTFNNWGGTLSQLEDPEGDGTYVTTLSGFSSSSTIEFKFRYNGQWDNREEFPGTGNNRVHIVGDADETLTFWYNDEEPPMGPAVAGISASSTFTFTNGSILFTEDAGGLVESYEWQFEGGSPATSTASSVSVSYEQPGTYDVTLRVANSFSEDELTLTEYIEVGEKSTDDLSWWNETTFYEIFVRSFYDSDGDGVGDFQGIIEKLDYLNDGDPNTTSDLGITGIWLMPIHESPSYHGYDVNDYRSINPDYGTMDDFKEFVDEAHKRGIKVIIDLVINHSSTEIEWFQNAASSTDAEKRNWYRWSDTKPSYSGPWGQDVWHFSSTGHYYGLFWGGMPDLNYDEPAVKEEIFDITRFWLEDIGLDGYRLDAVKYIKEEGSALEDLPVTHEFWREWVAVTKESNPDALSVGEAWTSTEKIVPYVVSEGLDFCFDFDLAGSIINGIRSQNASSVATQVNKVINSYPYYQFGTFTTNHDMNRLMNEFSNDEDKVKLAAAIYLTLPGIPFIYYGEEIGMTGSKPDENIRRPMAWDDSNFAGFSTQNPWNGPASNYRTNNVETQSQDGNSLLNWYRSLIQLRTQSEALQVGSYEEVTTDGPVLAYKRSAGDEHAFTLINMSASSREVTLDVSDLTVNAAEPGLINAVGDERIELAGKDEVTITVGAETAMVLVPGDLALSTEEDFDELVYPNPFSHAIELNLRQPADFSILTLEGKVVLKGTVQQDEKIVTETLEAGVYVLELLVGDRKVVKKIVKK